MFSIGQWCLKKEYVSAYMERIEKMFNLEVILFKYNDAYRCNSFIKKKIKINDVKVLRAYEW